LRQVAAKNESAAPLVLLLLLLWLLLQAGLLTSALLELIKLLLVDIDAQDHSILTILICRAVDENWLIVFHRDLERRVLLLILVNRDRSRAEPIARARLIEA